MTEIEEKSLKTQLEIRKRIQEADNMIIHTVHTTATQVLNEVIESKIYTKEGQTTIELTVDEFTKVRLALATLSNNEGFGKMNSWIKEKYLEPKKEMMNILSMLQ